MSKICLLRIDDRLIHGQVMTGWVKYYSATKIIIVDDELVNDDFMISVLEMAVPNNMTLNIYNIENAAAVINSIDNDSKDDRVIILVKSPLAVLNMMKRGVTFEKLTVGGMGINEKRSKLFRNLAASGAEREAFKEIDKMGLPIVIHVIPSDAPGDLLQHL